MCEEGEVAPRECGFALSWPGDDTMLESELRAAKAFTRDQGRHAEASERSKATRAATEKEQKLRASLRADRD